MKKTLFLTLLLLCATFTVHAQSNVRYTSAAVIYNTPVCFEPSSLSGQDGNCWAAGNQVNATAVTATNPSSIAALQSVTLRAGLENVVGKTIRVCGSGRYTTAAGQTPTVTITLKIGSVAVAAPVSAATTASATNMPWNACFIVSTISTGASGTVFSHGSLNLTLVTTPAAATSTYLDVNTAASSAIDLTAANAITLNATMSSSNAGNSVVEDLISAEVL